MSKRLAICVMVLVASFATLNAQTEKKTVFIGKFTAASSVPSNASELLRAKAYESIASMKRLQIVDDTTDTKPMYLVEGSVNSFTTNPVSIKDDKGNTISGYESIATYTYKISGFKDKNVILNESYTARSGFERSKDEALSYCIKHIRKDVLRSMAEIAMPHYAGSTSMEFDKKGRPKYLIAQIGSRAGIEKGQLFDIIFLRDSLSYVDLGNAKAIEIISDTEIKVEITKINKKNKHYLDEKKNIFLRTKGKFNLFTIMNSI